MATTIAEVRLIDLRRVQADAWTLLDEAERVRAARFRHPEDARRWIAARAALRTELGAALEVPAASLVFRYSARGKPALAGASAGRIAFNLSHSAEWVAIAMVRAMGDGEPPPVGVDIEAIRPLDELAELVERCFAPEEREAWCALDEALRLAAFYRTWARKEACVKALGVGIGAPLHAVDVRDPAWPRVRLTEALTGHEHAWSLRDFDAAPGIVGALAVPKADVLLQVHDLSRAGGESEGDRAA